MRIVDLQLQRLQARLHEKRITLELTPEAKAWLAERGYDPAFGARPLRRVIQREVETPLARMILEGRIPEGARVVARPGEAGLRFEAQTPAQA